MSILQSNESHITINADGASKEVRFQNNGTQNMVLDSSGNVGIGTTTPSNNHSNANNLVVGNGTAGGIANYVGTGLGWYAFSRDNANNTDAYDGGISYDGSRNLMFHTNAGSERMRITGSGKIALCTTSVSSDSQVAIGGGNLELTTAGARYWIPRASDGALTGSLYSGVDNDVTLSGEGSGSGYIRFKPSSGSGEALRIDSSGALLIGSTDDNPVTNNAGSTADNGISLNRSGNESSYRAARYNGNLMYLNRTGTDGDIMGFYKDATWAGAITTNGNSIAIGAQEVGLYFYYSGPNSDILPYDIGNNTTYDNAISLGNSSNRFKDLYLSGGAYIGGTSTANRLDDYEEGTWTPVIDNGSGGGTVTSSNTCGYVKIGNVVYLFGQAVFSNIQASLSTAQAYISFPFQASNSMSQNSVDAMLPIWNGSSAGTNYWGDKYPSISMRTAGQYSHGLYAHGYNGYTTLTGNGFGSGTIYVNFNSIYYLST